jgi:hypothetical protein
MSDALAQMRDALSRLDATERAALLGELGAGRPSARPTALREPSPVTPLNPVRTQHIRSEIEWV